MAVRSPGDLGYWRGRIEHLAETAPGSELLALLEERPTAMDEPLGACPPDGVASFRAQTRLDSMAARQKLISKLEGDQYVDAAELALEYTGQDEFLTSEVALALKVTESTAGALVSTAFALATRLPRTLVALQAGRITPDIATVMVGATTVVSDPDHLATIERTVLPTVAGRSRESVRRQINRQVIRLDPDGADTRVTRERALSGYHPLG